MIGFGPKGMLMPTKREPSQLEAFKIEGANFLAAQQAEQELEDLCEPPNPKRRVPYRNFVIVLH